MVYTEHPKGFLDQAQGSGKRKYDRKLVKQSLQGYPEIILFIGLPATLYIHILMHVQIILVHANVPTPGITLQKRVLEDTLSSYTDILVGGAPFSNMLAFKQPIIQLSFEDFKDTMKTLMQ
ncbi:hypothetical protein BDR06DRAFT_971900 [Suillus hirtellus]|nr:hypothetical protein BDR06DRAFT_971900 [Suillus hirtellus]